MYAREGRCVVGSVNDDTFFVDNRRALAVRLELNVA
jgi:hypothetical protein